MTFALIVVGGYLLGSCPWGYWLPLAFRGVDVRKHGSGSIGVQNASTGANQLLIDVNGYFQ